MSGERNLDETPPRERGIASVALAAAGEIIRRYGERDAERLRPLLALAWIEGFQKRREPGDDSGDGAKAWIEKNEMATSDEETTTLDPHVNLREQRALAAYLVEDDRALRLGHPVADAAARLAELVQALDEWLSRDGFLPEPWRIDVLSDAEERERRILMTARQLVELSRVEGVGSLRCSWDLASVSWTTGPASGDLLIPAQPGIGIEEAERVVREHLKKGPEFDIEIRNEGSRHDHIPE